MTDFASLQALGPMERAGAPGGPPRTGTLGRYLEHYQLSHLLADHVGLHVGFIEAGNFRLWAQVWSPAEPKGTAFVVHGYFDHLGLYRHLLSLLLNRGWRVVMWDLPGHGLSSGACSTGASHPGCQPGIAPRLAFGNGAARCPRFQEEWW